MARRIILFAVAFVVAMGALDLFPGIDLWASGLFHRPGAGFYLASWPPCCPRPRSLALFCRVAGAGIGGGDLTCPGRRRAGIFLLLALALGPGLMVNAVFKDHWGRARPAQVTEFGGDKHFVIAGKPSDQCRSNCSFPAGDPSVGFVLVSVAFLLPQQARRGAGPWPGPWGWASALGLVRIAQGGHFLSDVVASGFLVFGLSWALYRLIVAWDGLGALWAALKKPPPGLKNFILVTVAAALLFAYAVAFLDQPLMIFTHDVSPLWQGVFRLITEFGISTPYLAVAAVAAGIAFVAARGAKGAARQAPSFPRLARGLCLSRGGGFGADRGSHQAGGGARPAEAVLLRACFEGFTGFGPSADYWSFPSGHSVTAAALAFALCVIYPRWRWAWIAAALLVGSSRVGLDAHHLSDVIGGLYIGLATILGAFAAFRCHGIELSRDPESSARRKTAKRRR